MNEVAHEPLLTDAANWFDAPPGHWEQKRIKDLFEMQSAKGNALAESSYIPLENIESFTGKLLRTVSNENAEQTNLFRKGDLLLSKLRPYLGKVLLADFDGGVSGETIVSRVPPSRQQSVYSRYFFYRFLSTQFIFKINSLADGVKMPRTNPTRIYALPVPLPPFSEQIALAQYLDRHTAAIDRKIDLLEQKNKLYQTLRKTLINETVCRGLNPEAPRKDSGIEWIGEIPVHWEVKRLKDVGRVVLGKMLNTTGKAGYALKPYLKSKNITWLNPSIKSVDEMYFSPDELISYRIKKNDLLVSEGGEVGKTCIWNDELPECYIQNSVHKITIKPRNNPHYYLYLSFAMGAVGFYDSIVNQVSIKHLTWERFTRILVLVPPADEQQSIADHITKGKRKIDVVTANLKAQIATLKELRKTLINDVVTGKLNVTA